ncbi:MAG: rod shape-determining protein RodA [Thermaerobacter sp.]|nr:MAG: rod shape-determining protein RodA [Bacillota bacterium]
MLERRLLKHLDIWLPLLTLLLVAVGLVVIASATRTPLSGLLDLGRWLNPSSWSYIQRQAVWALAGIAAGALSLLFDYRALARWTNVLYGVTLGLLVLVLFVGDKVNNARSWLGMGPFRFQPAEVGKLTLIILLAAVLSRNEEGAGSWRDVLVTLAYLAPPLVLILMQPDLGTALVLLGILVGMLFMAGMPVTRFLVLVVGGLAAGLAAVVSKLYFDAPIPLTQGQIQRLIIFLNPGSDPWGAGYQILQSQYAIGSGRLWGRGLFQGEQIGLRYLPERHTDFVFSVVGEELGFVGATLLLLLIFAALARIFHLAAQAKDAFGFLIASGVGSMLAFHVVVNVGMTIGLMPVTGLPLPFVSYGGSALLTNCLGIGLVLNVHMRRHKLLFGS